ncbi:hypothetical protein CASFOL_042271 [Castilleja foliolosa]|uniref:Cyclin-dependent kinase inhibitor domain-containing protein n=1 Tax=Castilleja foliolosa TaxID=1961234 RepID=A0ABD3BAB1_9LAMI
MEGYLRSCESHVTTENEAYCGGEAEPEPESPVSPATSTTSGGSDKQEDHSNDVVLKRLSDLESEVYETEISKSIDRVFREATPTSELYGAGSKQVLLQAFSTPKKKSSSPENLRRKVVEITPSTAELDEFFEAAEKYDRERFIEKYNYDIVKDVPLEGKYQWVRLKD